MRYSHIFGKTIRSVSQDVRSKGHEFLLRGGFIRESGAGRFYTLPIGHRVQEQVCKIVQDEMNGVGAQQMIAPLLHPRELWAETRRTEAVSFELMQVKDRRGQSFVLGGTAEEMMVALVRQFSISEKDLPFCIYQFSAKFRDELRARGGLLRAREFLMKDAYSFHSSRDDFQRYYEKMGKAYLRIFERVGLNAILVESGNGYMGGEYAHEAIVEHPLGESRYLVSDDGRYAAHEDVAPFEREAMNEGEQLRPAEVRDARRGPSIADGVALHNAPAWRQIKSIIYVTNTNQRILVCIRGDLDVSEEKLLRVLRCESVRLATECEVESCNTVIGFVSPIGTGLRTIGDTSLNTVRNFITGANARHRDWVNVTYGRDFTVTTLADIAAAPDGARSFRGGATLRARRGIEVGNIFQLGTWYSERMHGASFMNSAGTQVPYYMGCYGIGIGRTIATIAETHHDEGGLLWPETVSPFRVHIISLGDEDKTRTLAEEIYSTLSTTSDDVLFDDREASAGVKFSDADLLGIKVRIVVSPRLSKDGNLELQNYRKHSSRICGISDCLTELALR